ncbi:MAG: hypothetical protein GY913_15230 [Proteobacteria bacterium]|nr:hypothetical protein [Pseudomonadota bacterium]MCP4918261.1 hypothetical protein [Pseudomonadota bacterium]
MKATVENTGNKTARSVEIVIELPETNTSPTVYVMGDVGSSHKKCSQSDTEIVCNFNSIKKGKSKTVWVDIALPWSADAIEFTADASTSSSESSTSNNDDTDVAEMAYIDTVLSGGESTTNSHCSGTGLTAFYECTLFPSSVMDHTAVLEGDWSISFPDFAGYGGTWWQDSDDHLAFEYTYGGSVVAEFEGNGGDCFEGLTTFPGSSYVAPYEVCID